MKRHLAKLLWRAAYRLDPPHPFFRGGAVTGTNSAAIRFKGE